MPDELESLNLSRNGFSENAEDLANALCGKKIKELSLTFWRKEQKLENGTVAESCVFSKQSPPPVLCHPEMVAHSWVILLPKLRMQFAEFLQYHYLNHLSILYSLTSKKIYDIWLLMTYLFKYDSAQRHKGFD